MKSRGIPLHDDADVALEHAVAMINGYKGHPPLQPESLAFTQKVVLDALPLAPTPIGNSWMRITLAAVAGLARWLQMTGQPLTREHTFSEETRFRYIATRTDQTEGSRNLNAVRLELIGDMLLGASPGRVLPKVTKTEEAPIEPLTAEDEADLWVWAIGLRRRMRRDQMSATLVLGLGCGLSRAEKHKIRHEDVHADEHGVHVWVTSNRTGLSRLVTCRADWEDRLAALKDYTAPGHLLMSPWRDTVQAHGGADEAMRRARNNTPVPVNFNNVRLRNTWLCHHLAAGTPLKVLMEAADMKEANHLHNLLALLPATDPVQAAAALRGRQADATPTVVDRFGAR